jgi:hypothetical protein
MSEFPKRLREEVIASQNRRGRYVGQKFTFVIGAFGLGALTTSAVETWGLLLLAPVIALAFDLYVAGESFGIRRIGAFLGSKFCCAPAEEQRWEAFASEHRDPFSAIGGPFLSIVVLGASTVLLFEQHGHTVYFWVWLMLSVGMIALLWWLSRRKNARMDSMKATLEELWRKGGGVGDPREDQPEMAE